MKTVVKWSKLTLKSVHTSLVKNWFVVSCQSVPPLRTILFLISSDLPSLAVLPSLKGSSRALFNVCVTSRSKTQIFSGGTSLETPGREAVVLPLSMLGVGVVEVQIPKQSLRREADKLCSWAVSGSRSRRPGLSSLLFFSLQQPQPQEDDKCFHGCLKFTKFGFVSLVVTTC